jgi:hypothetical protein
MSSSNFHIEQGGFSYEDRIYVYMGKHKLTERNLPKEKTPEWKALEARQKALSEGVEGKSGHGFIELGKAIMDMEISERSQSNCQQGYI